MKDSVTIEELNAATLLLTGVSVNSIAEMHIASGCITLITVSDDDSGLSARRIILVEPTENEYNVEPPEVDEDDGT